MTETPLLDSLLTFRAGTEPPLDPAGSPDAVSTSAITDTFAFQVSIAPLPLSRAPASEFLRGRRATSWSTGFQRSYTPFSGFVATHKVCLTTTEPELTAQDDIPRPWCPMARRLHDEMHVS